MPSTLSLSCAQPVTLALYVEMMFRRNQRQRLRLMVVFLPHGRAIPRTMMRTMAVIAGAARLTQTAAYLGRLFMDAKKDRSAETQRSVSTPQVLSQAKGTAGRATRRITTPTMVAIVVAASRTQIANDRINAFTIARTGSPVTRPACAKRRGRAIHRITTPMMDAIVAAGSQIPTAISLVSAFMDARAGRAVTMWGYASKELVWERH